MPRIRCHYIACVFLDDGYCGAARVEFDPDVGCTTYKRVDDPGDDWVENEDAELEDWDEIDDGDDLWIEDDY
jgi:hypothetical protein